MIIIISMDKTCPKSSPTLLILSNCCPNLTYSCIVGNINNITYSYSEKRHVPQANFLALKVLVCKF